MDKPRVVAIVPAYNEEKNIGRVLEVLRASPLLEEVLVVDDGSTDGTASVARQMGIRVIHQENRGKTAALRAGLEQADADIAVFFDADLVGLKQSHVAQLVEPMLQNPRLAMCMGSRERWWGLPVLLAKWLPVLAVTGAERAIRPFVLQDIPMRFIKNMTDVMVMNYYCKVNRLATMRVSLPGLDVVVKEKKYGLGRGLMMRVSQVAEMARVAISMRVHKKLFLKTENHV